MQSAQASTLTMEAVSKRFERGAGAIGVSLDLDAGEVVGVWGRRRSGRSTLLRLAAGIERPDSGVVRVEGADLWGRRGRRARGRDGIAVWHPAFPPDHGRSVERQVAIAARRGLRTDAEVREALARVGVADCCGHAPHTLDPRDAARVALARALVRRPRLLVLDEPASGLDALDAERLLELIVEIARADRIAVLLTAAEVSQLGGVDRHLSIDRGVLRGTTVPEPAAVLRMRRA